MSMIPTHNTPHLLLARQCRWLVHCLPRAGPAPLACFDFPFAALARSGVGVCAVCLPRPDSLLSSNNNTLVPRAMLTLCHSSPATLGACSCCPGCLRRFSASFEGYLQTRAHTHSAGASIDVPLFARLL